VAVDDVDTALLQQTSEALDEALHDLLLALECRRPGEFRFSGDDTELFGPRNSGVDLGGLDPSLCGNASLEQACTPDTFLLHDCH